MIRNYETTEKIYTSLGTSNEQIRAIEGAVSPPEHAALRGCIEADTDHVLHDVTAQCENREAELQAEVSFVGDRLGETSELRASSAQRLTETRSRASSWLLPLLYLPAGIACSAGEWAISAATLPAALGVAPDSLSGIAVSLTPVVGLFVAKEAIGNFLASASRRAETAFFALVLACNIAMILFMVLARNETVKAMGQISRGETVAFDESIVARFVLCLSLTVLFDGAVFFVLTLRYGRGWIEVSKAQLAVHRAAIAEQRLQQQMIKLQGQQRRAERDARDKPAIIARSFEKQCLYELSRLKVSYPTAKEMAEANLGLSSDRPTAVN